MDKVTKKLHRADAMIKTSWVYFEINLEDHHSFSERLDDDEWIVQQLLFNSGSLKVREGHEGPLATVEKVELVGLLRQKEVGKDQIRNTKFMGDRAAKELCVSGGTNISSYLDARFLLSESHMSDPCFCERRSNDELPETAPLSGCFEGQLILLVSKDYWSVNDVQKTVKE